MIHIWEDGNVNFDEFDLTWNQTRVGYFKTKRCIQ